VARPRKKLDFRSVASALTEAGSEDITMAAIAARIGVAKATLYRMAGSREELIAVCVDAEAERLVEQIHHGGFRAFFRFVEDSPAGFALLFGGRYPQSRAAVRRVENRLSDSLAREARATGAPLEHANLLAAGLLSLAAGVALRAFEEGLPTDSELLGSDFDEVAKTAARIFDPPS
jgi:AcrR family transcriptional regulator